MGTTTEVSARREWQLRNKFRHVKTSYMKGRDGLLKLDPFRLSYIEINFRYVYQNLNYEKLKRKFLGKKFEDYGEKAFLNKKEQKPYKNY